MPFMSLPIYFQTDLLLSPLFLSYRPSQIIPLNNLLARFCDKFYEIERGVYCGNGYARYARAAWYRKNSKQLRAHLETRAYLAKRLHLSMGRPLFGNHQKINIKINISLTITKIAKW